MADLLWPGDHRAGDVFSDRAALDALVAVEQAWLDVLVAAGLAPASAGADLTGLVAEEDLPRLAADAEAGGNPAMVVVAVLRDRLPDPDAARWLHRGLTSQDVVDSALMLCARDAVAELRVDLGRQVTTLAGLARTHRDTPMAARTLTQYAVPTTFGLRAATWLAGVLDAHDDAAALAFPVQVGGAAGTLSALTELAAAHDDPVANARRLAADLAERLGLAPATPWHTARAAVTRIGDAAVRATDAAGRIAADILTLGRPEIGELAEGTGGGSSTMPHKANPVLSTLVRRAALTTPQLAATLHLAAAGQVDERADGAWHAEWATLRDLLRRTVVAVTQTADLLADLRVHPDAMARHVEAAGPALLAEQRVMADLVGRAPAGDYLGAAGALVDDVLARAEATGAVR